MASSSSATQKPSRSAQSQSPLFRIPLEVRAMIYDLVLTTSVDIVDPHQLLSGNSRAGSHYWYPVMGLTPALLRTCWHVYEEATPALYRNLFVFTSPLNIHHFCETLTSADGKEVELCRSQRMTRIRLEFVTQPFYLRVNAARRKDVAELWTTVQRGFFNIIETRKALIVIHPGPVSGAGRLFPSLRHLELDFWPLTFPTSARFPRLLLLGIKNTGIYDWKLASLKVTGLPHHRFVTEIFEQALLENPAARRLTNARDQRI